MGIASSHVRPCFAEQAGWTRDQEGELRDPGLQRLALEPSDEGRRVSRQDAGLLEIGKDRVVHRIGRDDGTDRSTGDSLRRLEDDPELGRLVRLGLRVTVEFGYSSEVLGFGPYAGLAYSRQAPFTEVAIRAKPPRKPRRDKRAFMAHVDIFPPLDNPEMKEWWDQTEENRRRRLGVGHDARGKARVVFALPEQDWRRETV